MIQQYCSLLIYLFPSFDWAVFLNQKAYMQLLKKKKKKKESVILSRGEVNPDWSSPPTTSVSLSPSITLPTLFSLSFYLFVYLFFLPPSVSFIFADAPSKLH